MSFAAYDVNGYLGDVASGGGLAAFRRWAKTQPNRPALAAFLTDGHAVPFELAADLRTVMTTGEPESTRQLLLKYTDLAVDVLILSDGVGEGLDSATPADRFADWSPETVEIIPPPPEG
jgi:hypothetical protein